MIPADTGLSESALFSAARPSSPAALCGARAGDDVAAARQAARQFVGEAFFGLLLRELRKSTAEKHLLDGGRGEATLQPQLDQFLVERLAASRNFPLADAIVNHLYRDTEHSPIRSADGVVGGREA